MPVQRFVKKPVVISAWCWDGSLEEAEAIVEWAGTDVTTVDDVIQIVVSGDEEGGDDVELLIATLEGVMAGSPGDYVIEGLAGEFYPCKPDIFKRSYSLVGEG